MKTVADYWQEACSCGSGSLGQMPPESQAAYLTVFLGGFAACINMVANLANVSDEEALQHMRAVDAEMTELRGNALHTILGGTIQ